MDMTDLHMQPTSYLMNAAIESDDTITQILQAERRATERTYKSWDRFARDCLGDFVNTMLNDHWDEDSHDFLMVYDTVSPDHSSIVISGTGAQTFLGLPSSRFPAAQRLPSDIREEFLAAAGRAIKNEAPSRNSGIYTKSPIAVSSCPRSPRRIMSPPASTVHSPRSSLTTRQLKQSCNAGGTRHSRGT